MTVLSDRHLSQMYPDSPYIQPASIDLHLGSTLLWWPHWVRRDPRVEQSSIWKHWQAEHLYDPSGPIWVIVPGIRYLATTKERIKIQPEHAGELTGRSSWGRDGLEIHRTAGWLDPGYEGNPTLELSVVGSSLVLWPGAGVCQLILHELTSPCVRPYGHPDRQSKYQNDSVPTPSRLFAEVAS